MLVLRRYVASVALMLFLSASAGAADSARPQLTPDQWRADLRYLVEQMRALHKNLFHTVKPEALEAAVRSLDDRISSANEDEIVAGLVRLVALVQDAHTGAADFPPGKSYYPLRLRRYESGIYVEAAPREHASLVGGKLIAVDRTAAEDVWRDLLTLHSHDPGNAGPADTYGTITLVSSNVLHGLDISPTADSATFVIENAGRRQTVTFPPSVSFETLVSRSLPDGWTDARKGGSPALWLAHPERTLWYEYLPTTKTLFVQVNEILNPPGATFAAFFKEVFDFADAHPVDKFVLDLRRNGGGNNGLLRPAIVGIIERPPIDRRGHFFVIVGPATASAAQNFVNRLESYTNAVFVGRPSGENVNMYGDPAIVTLPNSKLRFGISTLWWQDKDPRDVRSATAPEIAAVSTMDDYRNNRDPALDAILETTRLVTVDEAILDAVTAGGIETGLVKYREWMADPRHRFQRDPEVPLNSLGYRLLGEKRFADAIAVLTLVTETHPHSSNAFDSLAEAYELSGQKAAAIANYRRALELNPDNASSRAAIQRLVGV